MNCPKCGASLVAGSGFCSGCGLQVATAAAGAPAKKNTAAKVILIVAVVGFVGVFFFGIVAAIAIPNLLSSIQRGKQKRTMGDMKTLAMAIEDYNADESHYPVAQNMDELCKVLTPDYLATCIHKDGWYSPQQPSEFAYTAWGGKPDHCKKVAEPDPSVSPSASDNPEKTDSYVIGSVTITDDGTGSPAATWDVCGPSHYGIASAGKDGKFEVSDFSGYDPRDMDSFEADIVLMDGQFVRTPNGKQRNTQIHDTFEQPPGPAPEDFVPSNSN